MATWHSVCIDFRLRFGRSRANVEARLGKRCGRTRPCKEFSGHGDSASQKNLRDTSILKHFEVVRSVSGCFSGIVVSFNASIDHAGCSKFLFQLTFGVCQALATQFLDSPVVTADPALLLAWEFADFFGEICSKIEGTAWNKNDKT